MPASPAAHAPQKFLGSGELAAILDHIGPLGCLDIGARGGVVEDIRPLGKAASVYGFEPDETECARLNDDLDPSRHPFGTLRFLPVALGPREERRTLNIMRHAGASSLLPPDPKMTSRFGARDAYFDVSRTVPVDTKPLDRVMDDYAVIDPVYMKIDVEGFELDILKGAETLLDGSLLAIRSEVAFLASHRGQPHFGDIASYLERFCFMPMGFLYLANWRSLTDVKHPRKVSGSIPYSRGQMVHGDVLFLRDPAWLDEGPARGVEKALALACLALLYDYVDFAYDIFKRPDVSACLRDLIGSDGRDALRDASRFLARRHDRRAARSWARNLVKRVTSEFKHVFA